MSVRAVGQGWESWDDLRLRVRAEAPRRGMRITDVGPAMGRSIKGVANALYSPTPPSAALQDALVCWLATPDPAPPSAGEPRLRMCAPSAKIPASGEVVSPRITAWEYLVIRLPDHDWVCQAALLTLHGEVGWRLVSVYGGVAYLCRKVPE